MITELLYLVLFTSIIVISIKTVTSEGMLLEKVGIKAEVEVERGRKIFELLACPWCMPSLYTLPAFIIAFGFDILPLSFHFNYIALYFLCVGLSSLICGTVWLIIGLLSAKKDYYEITTKHYTNVERMSHWDVGDRIKRFNEAKAKLNNNFSRKEPLSY